MVRALHAISGGPSRRRQQLKEYALEALVEGKPHRAVPALRSVLRLAYAEGDWGEVIETRELLARAYRDGTELGLAVAHLIIAGKASGVDDLVEHAGDTYLDVRGYLQPSLAYWRAAVALRVVTAQADIVPDDHVGEVVTAAVDVLDRARAGTLRDTPLLSPSVLLAAVAALAALARRLPEQAAARVLDHLSPWVPRAPNSYRYTDESHVRICVGVAETHAALRGAAVDQLLGLLAADDSGVSQRVEHDAGELFGWFRPLVEGRLRELAELGNSNAMALLALGGGAPEPDQLTAAATALAAPLDNTATSIGIGTAAVRDSHLAWHLPAAERRALVAVQLDRVAAPYEPGLNRSDYLLAAVNLSHDLVDTDELFGRALAAADDGNPSMGDLIFGHGDHPLGSFRTSGALVDTRPHAVFLAAALARTPDQVEQVRAHAVALLGTPHAGYFAVRALQKLAPADLLRDVPLLAVQADWAARSLAASTWAASSPSDATVGLRLARDGDVRVRRALAAAVARAENTTVIAAVEVVLREDRHFSVRSVLGTSPRDR